MKRFFALMLVMMLVASALSAKPKDNLSIDVQAEFKVDDSDITGDKYYVEYQVEGELEVKYQFTDRLSATVAVEIDRKDVDPEEISATYWIDEFSNIRAGLFDSSLTMNDFLKKKQELFFYDSPGVKYIKDSGFTNLDTGIEYKNRHFLSHVHCGLREILLFCRDWASVDLNDIDEVMNMKQAVNIVNSKEHVISYYEKDDDDYELKVSSKTLFYFSSQIKDPKNYLRMKFDDFIDVQQSIDIELEEMRKEFQD